MTKAKKPAVQVRQGDLLFIPMPKNLLAPTPLAPSADGRFVLATGEATGHAHTVSAAEALFGQMGTSRVLVVGAEGAEVTHEEHEVVVLQPDTTYKVVQQTEYDPRTRRNDMPRSNYD
jgi:hypothetical protein